MTDTTIIMASIITAFPATVAAILGFLNQLSVRRTERHSLATKIAVTELEKNTNSKMDALLHVVGEAEFAKGKLEGASLPAAIIRQEEMK